MMSTPEPGWMHLNNGGINRPSLLSGKAPDKAATAASGRILADMEGRKPQGRARGNRAAPQARAATEGRRPTLLIAGAGAVIALIILLLVFARSGDHDNTVNPRQGTVAAPSDTTTPAAPAQAPAAGAAMIVDAGDGRDTPPTEGMEGPLAAAEGSDGSGSDVAAASADNGAPPVPATGPGSAAPKRAAARRTAQSSSKSKPGEEDLLGTLLGIIKDEPKHESMDSLIAKIRADDQRNAENASAAFDSIGGKTSSGTSTASNIQAQLRRCPSAVSLQGIECRRRICKAHTGKDPACPAQ